MILAIRIRELVDALVAEGGLSSESLNRLDIHGRLNSEQLAGWAQILTQLPVIGVSSISTIDALGDPVDLVSSAAELAGQELRIQVVKTTSTTTVFCITTDGLRALFSDFNASNLVRQVWVASDFQPFRTEGCRVDPWGNHAHETAVEEEMIHAPDPRRLVKDFVGGRVPKSVFPYLLAIDAPEPVPSLVFETWKGLAVVRLLYSLVNEVLSTDKEQVVITGTRPRKIDSVLKSPISNNVFGAATEAARWIYASGRDVDIRFTLFTYELSREWPDAMQFTDGFAARGGLALEAAKTAFCAHVQETSKDTLKSLAELRKTLSEEVTKVVSQTRDLLATMWRDFLVATTALLGRVVLLGSDKPLNNPGPLKALLTGAAFFLVFSLILSLRTNAKFMTIAETSRIEWRKKLYGFLNDEDFKKLSDNPLSQSADAYKRVQLAVIIAYLMVVICLLWSAWEVDTKTINGSQVGTQQASTVSVVPSSGAQAPSINPAQSSSAALQSKSGRNAVPPLPANSASKAH